jgi:sulfatase maturation enzyme AslB (radical SAM superfamily)
VVASTLYQLDANMCEFFKEHGVYLSTSIDGPRELHNRNRPKPGQNSYELTVAGIQLAREHMSHDAVAALMTTEWSSICKKGRCSVALRIGAPQKMAYTSTTRAIVICLQG